MPFDIAEDIYRYLAHDWGLMGDKLTDAKCNQLKNEIPELRNSYQRNRQISYRRCGQRTCHNGILISNSGGNDANRLPRLIGCSAEGKLINQSTTCYAECQAELICAEVADAN